MEANTILLNVRDYNELRDFRKNVLAGKSIYVTRSFGCYGETSYEYFTDSEMLTRLGEENSKLSEKIKNNYLKYSEKEEKLRAELDSERETIYSSIKKMSFLQLLKFWIT